MSELKECPFCGSEAKSYPDIDDCELICCSNERCDLFYAKLTELEWNNRPEEDRLKREVEKLKEENIELIKENTVTHEAYEGAMAENDKLKADNESLKKTLFVVRELAVCDFHNTIVGIADRAIGDFEMPEQEFKEYLEQEK